MSGELGDTLAPGKPTFGPPAAPRHCRVALTFDVEHPDRPHRREGTELEILDVLSEADVRATFFLQGRWVTAYPEIAREIARRGHVIGNHSQFHVRIPLLTAEGLRRDVREAEDTIRTIVGVDPRPWFRCPWGDGADDPLILEQLDELGYRNVHWNVEPEDWNERRAAEAVHSNILEQVGAGSDEAVVLLHAWPSTTPSAVRGALGDLRSAGNSMVTIAELL